MFPGELLKHPIRSASVTARVEAYTRVTDFIRAWRVKQGKTFKQCAVAYIAAHRETWSNAKHAAQWGSTLENYAYPVMGDMLVRDVSLPHVLAVLEPIWATKTETATRLRGRTESVLDWATVREYRAGLNPARWKGHLDSQPAGHTRQDRGQGTSFSGARRWHGRIHAGTAPASRDRCPGA